MKKSLETTSIQSIGQESSLHGESIISLAHSRNAEAAASALCVNNQMTAVRESRDLSKQMARLVHQFQSLDKREDFAAFLKRKSERRANLSISFDSTAKEARKMERKLCKSEFMSYPVGEESKEG